MVPGDESDVAPNVINFTEPNHGISAPAIPSTHSLDTACTRIPEASLRPPPVVLFVAIPPWSTLQLLLSHKVR